MRLILFLFLLPRRLLLRSLRPIRIRLRRRFIRRLRCCWRTIFRRSWPRRWLCHWLRPLFRRVCRGALSPPELARFSQAAYLPESRLAGWAAGSPEKLPPRVVYSHLPAVPERAYLLLEHSPAADLRSPEVPLPQEAYLLAR